MKNCCKCGETKPLDQFPKRKDSPDGYRNDCVDCRRAYNHQNYLANRDERLAKQKAYYQEHREDRAEYSRRYSEANKVKISAYHAAYRERNREKSRQYFREHYQRNRSHALKVKRKYRRNNRDAVRAWNNTRKARQRNAPVSDFSPQQWRKMKEAYGHRCVYCGNRFSDLTMDHVVPLANGGAHTASNIVPACMPCNNGKKTGPPPPMVVTPDWSKAHTQSD